MAPNIIDLSASLALLLHYFQLAGILALLGGLGYWGLKSRA